MSAKAEAWPTEAAATAAVDAAARKHWETFKAGLEKQRADERLVLPPFDELHPVQQLAQREAVLPLVWEALKALPDPRHAAWAEGFTSGASTMAPFLENPYPSGL